jgi:hypothetical protein
MSDPGLIAGGIAVPDVAGSFALETYSCGAGRRRGPRIAILPARPGVLSWREGSSETAESVFATSISRFGCALRSRAFLRPGTRVRLEFAPQSIEGRVVYSLKDCSNSLVTMGVAFDQDGGEFWQRALNLGCQSF